MKSNKINYECNSLSFDIALNSLKTLIESKGYEWGLVSIQDMWRSGGTVKITGTYKGLVK